MRRLLAPIGFWIIMFGCQIALAAGTPANTTITTQATAEYTIGAATVTQSSNIVSATVAELLNIHATWQDSTPVVAHPADENRMLTFRITNTGNGTETYSLAGTGAVSGNHFDPIITAIYLDADGDGLLEPTTDTLYHIGTNDPILAPDEAMTIFVQSTIPGNPTDGDRGDCRISVTSLTGTGSPGDTLNGMGDGGTDAVFGASGAMAETTGTYAVSNAHLSVTKSATVLDLQGGALPSTDAVITYRIEIQVTGSGTAQSVVFSDPIPANTTYQPNSLILNGMQLSDATDSDAGQVDTGNNNIVTVNLGDLADTTPLQTISFEVTIN